MNLRDVELGGPREDPHIRCPIALLPTAFTCSRCSAWGETTRHFSREVPDGPAVVDSSTATVYLGWVRVVCQVTKILTDLERCSQVHSGGTGNQAVREAFCIGRV